MLGGLDLRWQCGRRGPGGVAELVGAVADDDDCALRQHRPIRSAGDGRIISPKNGGVTAVSSSATQLYVTPVPFYGYEVDLDGDGVVGIIDFLLLLANWTE